MTVITEPFDIQEYMTKGVERVVGDSLKATFKDPRESAFLVKFAAASAQASKKRRIAENNGGTYTSVSDCQYHQPM